MCCFSRPVRSVKRTRIFARHWDTVSQLIAYQMSYEADESLAMILPIPVADQVEDAISFIDLSSYEELFADLAKGFPRPRPFSIGCAMEVAAPASDLAVHQVGDYIASFVPHVDDFDRLDPQFSIPSQIWKQVAGYEDFGFAVFQLQSTSGEPHPMAFRYRAADPQKLFFPTMHIHDGQVHESEQFDHMLYLQHAGFDSRVGRYENSLAEDSATDWVRSDGIAEEFIYCERSQGLVEPELLVHRKRLKGDLPNRDTWVAPEGDPFKRTVNWRQFSPLTWIGLLLLPVAWLIWRRTKLADRDAGG